MKKIFFVFIFFIITRAFSSEVSVILTLDQTELSLNDTIGFNVSVEGGREAEIDEIQGSKNFEIESRGVSSSYQIINFNTPVITKTYSFSLTPQKVGSHYLGPVVVKHNGKEYFSNKVLLKISKESSVLDSKGSVSENYFVTGEISKSKVFVSEQILYVFRLFSRVNIRNPKLSLPNFEGFWKEELGDIKQYSVVRNGLKYQMSEIRYALFPLKEGLIVVPGATLSGEVVVEGKRKAGNNRRTRRGLHSLLNSLMDDPFYSNNRVLKKIKIKTDPIELNIMPLPQYIGDGKFSGLVGNFELSAHIDKNQLKKGDSATLSLMVSGAGNLFDLSGEFFQVENIKTYEDRPKLSKDIGEKGISGKKIFKKALVPQDVGVLKLPSFKLVVFVPEKNEYVTLLTEEILLNVLPGNGKDEDVELVSVSDKSNNGVQKKKVKVLGQDIMPLIQSDIRLKRNNVFYLKTYILYFLIFILPLIYFVIYYLRKNQNYQKTHSHNIRELKAYRNFSKKVKNIKDGTHFLEDFSNLFCDYFGDKLGIDGRTLTPFDIERIFRPYNISSSLTEEVIAIFKVFEQARFGGAGASLRFDLVRKRIEKAVVKFDKEKNL